MGLIEKNNLIYNINRDDSVLKPDDENEEDRLEESDVEIGQELETSSYWSGDVWCVNDEAGLQAGLSHAEALGSIKIKLIRDIWITQNCRVSKRLSLDGDNHTIFCSDGYAMNNNTLFQSYNGGQLSISNVWIDCRNLPVNSTGFAAISASYYSTNILNNCHVRNGAGGTLFSAFETKYGSRTEATNCSAYDCDGNGFYVFCNGNPESAGNTLICNGCSTTNTRPYGFGLSGSSNHNNMILTNCSAECNRYDNAFGIVLNDNATITNCNAFHNKMGIYNGTVPGSNALVVSGGNYYSNSECGIKNTSNSSMIIRGETNVYSNPIGVVNDAGSLFTQEQANIYSNIYCLLRHLSLKERH